MVSLRRSCITNATYILTDGPGELEAVGTIVLLRRAGIRIDVYVIDHTAATGRSDITISNLADAKDVNTADYDMLFLPGGPYYQKLEADERVLSILKGFMDQGKLVSAICVTPTTLGRQGYLKGRKYTCFTSMNEDFGGTYVDQHVVIDGTVITERSAAAVIDFAFAIIEKLEGRKKVEEVRASIYY